MPVATRSTARAYSPQKAQRELEDLQIVLRARNGDSVAMDALIRRYTGFVRLKASSYFLAGGDSEDLIQEGLVGCLGTGLSGLEADALRLYLEGASYEDMAERLGCDTKTIDNALQRVKRKILTHQKAREVLQ